MYENLIKHILNSYYSDLTRIIILPELHESKNSSELVLLALKHLYGINTPENIEKAIELLQKAGNNSYALFMLGKCYEHGLYFKSDLNKALELYRSSGNCFALSHLAYHENKPELYKIAYAQGNYHAGIILADMEDNMDIYVELASFEYAPALNYLGYCYLMGEGVPKNRDMAIYMFQQSAQQGNRKGIEMMNKINKKLI